MNSKYRKKQILEAATELCRNVGFDKMTRDGVAELAGVGNGTVTLYFNTMTQLRRAVVRRAEHQSDPFILGQLLASPTYKKRLSADNLVIALRHLAG